MIDSSFHGFPTIVGKPSILHSQFQLVHIWGFSFGHRTYTLDGYRFHVKLRPKLSSELLSGIFARDVIDGDVGAFTCKVLGDEGTQASVYFVSGYMYSMVLKGVP